MRLIQTDTHATLNGYSKSSIDGYFECIEAEARQRDFTVCRLDDLVRANEQDRRRQLSRSTVSECAR